MFPPGAQVSGGQGDVSQTQSGENKGSNSGAFGDRKFGGIYFGNTEPVSVKYVKYGALALTVIGVAYVFTKGKK